MTRQEKLRNSLETIVNLGGRGQLAPRYLRQEGRNGGFSYCAIGALIPDYILDQFQERIEDLGGYVRGGSKAVVNDDERRALRLTYEDVETPALYYSRGGPYFMQGSFNMTEHTGLSGQQADALMAVIDNIGVDELIRKIYAVLQDGEGYIFGIFFHIHKVAEISVEAVEIEVKSEGSVTEEIVSAMASEEPVEQQQLVEV